MAVLDKGDITSVWTHNGSVMGLVRYKKERALVYIQPRKGLGTVGIDVGVPLFQGATKDGRRYSGLARTFGRCGSLDYEVKGEVSADSRRIVLKGKAPKFEKDCRILGTRNETMVFDFVESAAEVASRGELAD
jgi:hypothetical protein